MYDIKKRPLGIYEKALPNDFTWLEKMQAAKQAGFDYIEISIDESDERLARLDWSDEQIEEIRSYMKETGIIIPSMCLSGHSRFPLGSKIKEISIKNGLKEKVLLKTGNLKAAFLVKKTDKIKIESILPSLIDAPVKEGQKVGEIKYLINGKSQKSVPIYAKQSVKQKDYWYYFEKIIQRFTLIA